MSFSIRCTFKPGGARERFAIRVPHIEYMTEALPFTVLGGARLDDEAESDALGMMVVVDLPDRAAVQSFIENEPYRMAGLFETVEIERFKVMTASVLRAELRRERAKMQARGTDSNAESALQPREVHGPSEFDPNRSPGVTCAKANI